MIGAFAVVAALAVPAPLHPRTVTHSLALLGARDEQARDLGRALLGVDPLLWAVEDAAGREAVVLAAVPGPRLPISACLARALLALSRHHEALERAHREPVAHARLVAALLRPSGLAEVRGALAAAWAGPTVFDRATGEQMPFEPGGIVYLDERSGEPVVRLVAVEDPLHEFARGALERVGRPEELRAWLAADPLRLLALDPMGLVRAALDRYPARGPWGERERRGMRLAVAAVTANVADSWGLDPAAEVRAIVAAEPCCTHAGLWHGHPGRRGGGAPSEEDRAMARAHGRFLTLVEVAGGVDVHDLTASGDHPPVALRWADDVPRVER